MSEVGQQACHLQPAAIVGFVCSDTELFAIDYALQETLGTSSFSVQGLA